MALSSALVQIGLVVVGLCLVVVVVALSVLAFGFLFKAGVILREARRPPYADAGDYRLSQGREVRSEQADRGAEK